MKELLDRIESCNYECEAGPLTGNVDWIELRRHYSLLCDFADAMRQKGVYPCETTVPESRHRLMNIYTYDHLDQPDAE